MLIRTNEVQVPLNGRREVKEDEVLRMMESIQRVGLLHPIVVRRVKRGWEVMAGEKRLHAMRRLGEEWIEATIIHECDPALVFYEENTARTDLCALDKVLLEAEIHEKHKSASWGTRQSAALLGLPCSVLEKDLLLAYWLQDPRIRKLRKELRCKSRQELEDLVKHEPRNSLVMLGKTHSLLDEEACIRALKKGQAPEWLTKHLHCWPGSERVLVASQVDESIGVLFFNPPPTFEWTIELPRWEMELTPKMALSSCIWMIHPYEVQPPLRGWTSIPLMLWHKEARIGSLLWRGRKLDGADGNSPTISASWGVILGLVARPGDLVIDPFTNGESIQAVLERPQMAFEWEACSQGDWYHAAGKILATFNAMQEGRQGI